MKPLSVLPLRLPLHREGARSQDSTCLCYPYWVALTRGKFAVVKHVVSKANGLEYAVRNAHLHTVHSHSRPFKHWQNRPPEFQCPVPFFVGATQ